MSGITVTLSAAILPSATVPRSYRFDSGRRVVFCAPEAARFRRRFNGALAARDPGRAADLLEAYCDELFARGEAQIFATCVHRLPEAIQRAHPRTMLALAWRLIAQWRFEQATELLVATRARIARLRRCGRRESTQELEFLLRHREAMLAQVRDDMPTAEALCCELLQSFATAGQYVKGSLYTALLHASREQYSLREMDRYDALARD
jgi:ATP/maltotriose-dependent transcriptional regulator MalT